jgi:hypothetical protein
MVCEPYDNLDAVSSAEPEVSFSVANTVLPSKYLILPVGVPANDETVAVNVTDLSCVEGLTDETTEVVVAALVTT